MRAAALGGPREDAVVRPPVRGAAVGVVEGERARPRTGPDLVEGAEQRAGVERLPVLVDTEVRVRVEDDVVRHGSAASSSSTVA